MSKEGVTPIPAMFRTYYDVKADLDGLTGLLDGELGFAYDEKILYRQDGDGAANWVVISIIQSIPDAIAGDIDDVTADAVQNTTSATYVKVKEVLLGRAGTYRIKFDMKSSLGGQIVYGMVYKNGVAFGTEQSTTLNTYSTFSEDISGFVYGDLVQLYIKKGGTGDCYVNNYRFYLANPIDNYAQIN